MARRDALIVGSLRDPGLGTEIADTFDVTHTEDGLDGLDLVVHCDYPDAARRPHNLVDLSAEEWHDACDAPLEAAIRLAQRVHPHLAVRHGTMVFLVPLMASAGGEGFTPFATAAEGVRILAKSLAKTWGHNGINVHAITVDPHLFLADADADGIAEANALHDPPLGHIPAGTETGRIIRWLASDDAAALTGASLVVDGGLWMPG